MRTLISIVEEAMAKLKGNEEKVYCHQYLVGASRNSIIKKKIISLKAYELVKVFSKNTRNSDDDPGAFISVQHRKSREVWLLNPVTTKQFSVNLMLGLYDVEQ